MPVEIERKFLVPDFNLVPFDRKYKIWQGYLAKTSKCSIRIRTIDEDRQVFLTVKSSNAGMSRREIEMARQLSEEDVNALKEMCVYSLEKTRHVLYLEERGEVWEIDVFHGPFDNLALAEIELPFETYGFIRPDWLGEEVTDNGNYYNYTLAMNQCHPGNGCTYHAPTREKSPNCPTCRKFYYQENQ